MNATVIHLLNLIAMVASIGMFVEGLGAEDFNKKLNSFASAFWLLILSFKIFVEAYINGTI